MSFWKCPFPLFAVQYLRQMDSVQCLLNKFPSVRMQKEWIRIRSFPMWIVWWNIVCTTWRSPKLLQKSMLSHSSTQLINGLMQANSDWVNSSFLFDKILLCSPSSSLMCMEMVRFLWAFLTLIRKRMKLVFWSCTTQNESKPTEHFARSFVVKQYPHYLQQVFLLPSTKWDIRRTPQGEEANKRKVSSVKIISLFRLYLDILKVSKKMT